MLEYFVVAGVIAASVFVMRKDEKEDEDSHIHESARDRWENPKKGEPNRYHADRLKRSRSEKEKEYQKRNRDDSYYN